MPSPSSPIRACGGGHLRADAVAGAEGQQQAGAHILSSSNDYPGLITDVIVARTTTEKESGRVQEIPARHLSGRSTTSTHTTTTR